MFKKIAMPQNVKKFARTGITFVFSRSCYERPTGKSVTVPGESYSLRDLLARHIRGERTPDTLYRVPAFDSSADFDTDDIEKMQHMDLFDREEYSRNLAAQMVETEKKVDADRKQASLLQKQEEDDLSILRKRLREEREAAAAGNTRQQAAGKAADSRSTTERTRTTDEDDRAA